MYSCRQNRVADAECVGPEWRSMWWQVQEKEWRSAETRAWQHARQDCETGLRFQSGCGASAEEIKPHGGLRGAPAPRPAAQSQVSEGRKNWPWGMHPSVVVAVQVGVRRSLQQEAR